MALVPVTMLYDTKAVIDATGLLNGQILYTIDQTINKIYADVLVDGTLKRIEIGGTNTIDTVLDQDSGHAIANSAVAKLAQTVHTNLLNPTLGTTTINGVTCTNNGDGTYTLNGTANAQGATIAFGNIPMLENGKTYKFCGTPSGGNYNTYRTDVVSIRTSDSQRTVVASEVTGKTFDAESGYSYEVRAYISPNTTIANLTFKPMLTTDTSATYDDFVGYSGDGELNENVAKINRDLSALFDVFHPVGTLYETLNADFNPNTASGWSGTWERIKDRFIYACGDNQTIGSTGGSNTHTLTVSELPVHSHGLNGHTHGIPQLTGTAISNGAHTHAIYDEGGAWYARNGGDLSGTTTNNVAVYYGTGSKLIASSAGAHTHSVTTNESATLGNTGTTTNTGSGTAFDNRPAFITAYIWKRTA